MPQCCSCQSFLKRISLFTTISYLALICCPPGNWDVETGSQTPSSSSLPSSNRNPGSPWRLGCRWRNTTSHLWDVADIWRLHIEHTFYPFKLVWEDFLLWILTSVSHMLIVFVQWNGGQLCVDSLLFICWIWPNHHGHWWHSIKSPKNVFSISMTVWIVVSHP